MITIGSVDRGSWFRAWAIVLIELTATGATNELLTYMNAKREHSIAMGLPALQLRHGHEDTGFEGDLLLAGSACECEQHSLHKNSVSVFS